MCSRGPTAARAKLGKVVFAEACLEPSEGFTGLLDRNAPRVARNYIHQATTASPRCVLSIQLSYNSCTLIMSEEPVVEAVAEEEEAEDVVAGEEPDEDVDLEEEDDEDVADEDDSKPDDESTVDAEEVMEDDITVKSDDASSMASGSLKSTPQKATGKQPTKAAAGGSAKKGRSPSVRGLTIPFRTVKKAMKADPDTPIVQNEAAVMTTIAAELFLKSLAKESFRNAKNRGRNTIRYE